MAYANGFVMNRRARELALYSVLGLRRDVYKRQTPHRPCTIKPYHYKRGDCFMKHIQTLNTRDMAKSLQNGGCGECQTSCQSACKTSCGIANQPCEKK